MVKLFADPLNKDVKDEDRVDLEKIENFDAEL